MFTWLVQQQQQQSHQFTTSVLGIVYFFIFIIFLNLHHTNASMFIYGGCSADKYQPNSPYEISLNALLSSMVTSASQSLYNSFAVGNDTSASFGLYQCRGDLKIKDCTTCVASLVGQIELVCPYTYGASLQLDVCFVRYDRVDFLGKPDTSVRYKKCSTSVSNDVEFLKRRDYVLADMLQASATGFRVSSSGSVEGYAQCDGDLIAADCSSCLSIAIMQLKSLCGSAAAADVFLAQCYARYWASGYYGSSESYKHDDVGKTVAIIVGVLAGVFIIIVLLSLCRTSIGNVAGAIAIMQGLVSGTRVCPRLAYDFFRDKGTNVWWSGFVWKNKATPKHCFILWLAMKNCLLTSERPYFVDNKCYSLCRTCDETAAHLFF